MQLYKETVFIAVGTIVAVAAGIFLTQQPKKQTQATVDGKTPLPVLVGKETLKQKRAELLTEQASEQQASKQTDSQAKQLDPFAAVLQKPKSNVRKEESKCPKN